jgi:hypothetical protein
MKFVYPFFIVIAFLLFLELNQSHAQGIIIDDFSKKAMPDWIFGGVEMKYSHSEDNKENGYADILSTKPINKSEYIGKIFLKRPHLFQPGNFINIMINGADNDAAVTVKIIYDLDNDMRYDKTKDALLETEPVSINFTGWKELKIKLDQDNFKLKTDAAVGFEITEDEALGVQLDFESGSNYTTSVFKSGIALVSEIQNKEAIEGFDNGSSTSESYFGATNSPNPFNPVTTITYTLPSSTNVSITVYDRLGRQVEVLIDQNQDSGEHSIEFNASKYPSGIYFYRIKTPEKTEVRKMLLSK